MLALFAPDRRATGAQACRDTTDRRTRETTARPPAPIHNEKKAPHRQPQHLTKKGEISAHRLHIMDSWGKVTLFVQPFALDAHFSTTP